MELELDPMRSVTTREEDVQFEVGVIHEHGLGTNLNAGIADADLDR
ncbi:hypothetical protein ACEUZ9_002866 [Paracoccus litorisediminis]